MLFFQQSLPPFLTNVWLHACSGCGEFLFEWEHWNLDWDKVDRPYIVLKCSWWSFVHAKRVFIIHKCKPNGKTWYGGLIIIMIMIRFVACTYPPCWVLKARIHKHRASPFSFTISVLGSFTCITQHTGPTALRPIRRTKQLWLSVLLKDTSAVTGQAGIRTHILATPELESNALDRSAMTLKNRKIVNRDA